MTHPGDILISMNQSLQKNIFDFQSHTMSHNHVFVSDKIIDFYSPDKFNKYYWLMAPFPDLKSKWMEQMDKLSEMIPAGYPLRKP